MSKKIAAGADAIVLDVKVGTGAFMKTLAEANALAGAMVRIGRAVGRNVSALISDMNQPLGLAVGNALEVREAIDTLLGNGPEDFYEHCLVIAGEMLYLSKMVKTRQDGINCIRQTINSGAALKKLKQLVAAQGGDVRYIDNPLLLPAAKYIESVRATQSGYIHRMQADEIGMAVVDLGGGRLKKGDSIDYGVGVVMHVKIGDEIKSDQPLFTVHANSKSSCEKAKRRIKSALEYSAQCLQPPPLFYE